MRLVRWLAPTLIAASTALAQTARGTSFEMHVKVTAVGDGPMAAIVQSQQSEWRGAATTVGARGRIDVTEGSSQGAFLKQGDFMLFDGGESIVVTPADKTFLVINPTAQVAAGQAALGQFQTTVSNVIVKLDSLGAGETIDGRATAHYRVSSSYELAMGAVANAPAASTTQTMDFWMANVGSVPPTPFIRTGQPSISPPAGPMAEHLGKLANAMAGLPRGMFPIRQITSTRMTVAGVTTGTDNAVEMSNVKTTDVDLDRLTAPADFTMRVLPNMPPPSDSTARAAAAKWQTRPK